MRVAVSGGTGTLGSLAVRELLARGVETRVLSRGAGGVPAGAVHRPIDLADGEGLDGALEGVDVVLDAANSTRAAKQILVGGSERLLAAGARAGVRHHLAISIVGCDRVPLSYYAAKVAQEQAIAAGPLPWTVLRATQFHPLLDQVFTAAARWGVRPTGRMQVQPIDPALVAARLVDAALAEPAGTLPDLAGPRIETVGELSDAWRRRRGRRLLPLRVPALGKAGGAVAAGGLCNAGAAAEGPDFEEWLSR